MKTYLKIIITAIIIGVIIALVIFSNISNEVNALINKDNIIYIFQVGAYKDKNNAIKCMEKYNQSIIYYNDPNYLIFIGVAPGIEIVKKLEKEYKDENIDYYIKELKVSKKIIDELNQYGNLIIKTNNSEVISRINKLMLERLELYLNNI